MRKIFMMALLFVAMTMTGYIVEDSSSKVIRVGLDDEFAPLGFRDTDGNIVGFDVDLAKEVARRMGVKAEFVPINWDNKEEEITSGNIDMIWNGLDITDERKEYMIFSKPYMNNRQMLMTKIGNADDIRDAGDLKGKIVATQAGSNSEDYINANPKLKESFKEFKTYRSVQEGFDALGRGEYDVIIVDELAGRYETLENANQFEMIETTIGTVTELGIGFRKDNIELRDKVQEVFDTMVKDGTASKISERWFNADLIKNKR